MEPGSVIGERYRVIEPLGRGGMGAVYRVEHLMMKKELALKLLHPELGRLEEVARRFEREAEAVARLSHPNIISVTDFGRTPEGTLFLVMELLHGPSLTQVIRPPQNEGQGQRMEPQRALHILGQILRALEHAHKAGIVHRDLKPDNIVLIEREGDRDFVKLLDFGIAKITDDSKDSLTQAGVVFGTPEYLSPEQAMGEEADGRADLYAAGVILYEMLTGARPYEGQSRVEVVSMHLTKAIPSLPADLPRGLDRLVHHAMAKKREERFADAATFIAALAKPPPAPIPRKLYAGAAALVAVLLLTGIFALRPSRKTTSALSPAEDAQLNEARDKLRTGKSCRERKVAALKLIASDEDRWLDALRAARDRRGGFLDLEEVNSCMRRELDAAIRKLSEPSGAR